MESFEGYMEDVSVEKSAQVRGEEGEGNGSAFSHRLLCVTSPVTVFLIVFTLLVTILLHIKNCLDLSFNLYENPFPEVKIWPIYR